MSLDSSQTTFKPKNVACSINPYEILEPIKVDNILVDLSTDTENTHDSLQLGSFIDTVRKTEYDLVDLYQNIYVTPLHIQKTNGLNATDFTDYFDKLELDDKKDGPSENKSNARASEFLKLCTSPNRSNVNVNEVRNDILNEKLKPLNNEYKPKLECHFNKSKPAVNEIKFNKDISTKNIDNEFMEHNKIKEILRVVNDVKSMNIKQDNNKGIKKLHVIDMINDKQFNGSIKNGLLQTVKRNEKLYAKQRNILLHRNLTKGADIYEKSIVLPQMMERLAARKKILDEQKNLKRRLILGGPICSNKKENFTGFEPVVLMKDCNEERLKSLATRLLFADFVKNGKTED